MTPAPVEAPPRPIVFLHVPKTAGQTIHHALTRAVGGQAHVSPIRTHTEAAPQDQFPPGYRLYSGHLDWIALDRVTPAPFVFTVLRDPRERIASFYFFLEKEAKALAPQDLAAAHNTGKRRLLETSADDYFFGGDRAWQTFVRDHYDNFYCTYFATRRMRGYRMIERLPRAELLGTASAALSGLNGVYDVDDLGRLEADVAALLGRPVPFADTFHNTGALTRGEARWPHLLARFERDASRAALERFAEADMTLYERFTSTAG